MGCSPPAGCLLSTCLVLSVSPKRIDGLQPSVQTDAQAGASTFSIPKADRWAAANVCSNGRSIPCVELSVSPKRIDGLQHVFARLAERAFGKWLSVSPKRIDGLQLASCISSRNECVPFQYPQSGSMGCSPTTCRSRSSTTSCFQYPQSGSMGCSGTSRPTSRLIRWSLSVSPKRIDGLQRQPGAWSCLEHGPLSVSPKRIDGLQRETRRRERRRR